MNNLIISLLTSLLIDFSPAELREVVSILDFYPDISVMRKGFVFNRAGENQDEIEVTFYRYDIRKWNKVFVKESEFLFFIGDKEAQQAAAPKYKLIFN